MGDVVSLGEFRNKKDAAKMKKVNSSTVMDKDLQERVERIRGSISRINELLAELRKMT